MTPLRSIGRCLCGCSAVAALTLPAISLAEPKPGDQVPDIYNCFFVDGPITPSFEARAAASQAKGRLVWVFQNFPGFTIRAAGPAIEKMQARNPLIDHCAMATVVGLPVEQATTSAIGARGAPGGGGRGGGGGGGAKSDTVPWGVAYVKGGVGNNGGRAWVVDTGVSASTGDLTIDGQFAKVFLSVPNSIDGTSTQDYNGHGTHVAGTIGALKNGKAVVGVAPGARIVPIKVLSYAGTGLDSDVAAGLDWVLGHAAPGDAVNLSISGDVDSSAMDIAVQAFSTRFGTNGDGPYLVIAAGNSSPPKSLDDPAHRWSPPADIDGNSIFTVSVIDAQGGWASFANYGSSVDMAEPGVDIVSLNTSGRTAKKSGTSMAAPHLTGILLSSGAPTSRGTATDPSGQPVEIGANP